MDSSEETYPLDKKLSIDVDLIDKETGLPLDNVIIEIIKNYTGDDVQINAIKKQILTYSKEGHYKGMIRAVKSTILLLKALEKFSVKEEKK